MSYFLSDLYFALRGTKKKTSGISLETPGLMLSNVNTTEYLKVSPMRLLGKQERKKNEM